MKKIIFVAILTSIFLGNCHKQQFAEIELNKTRYEKWTEDIIYFEDKFLKKAKTYTKQTKKSCKVILANLKTNINNLSDIQITLELSKCVVLANNGHTTLILPKMDKLPLRLYRFSDGLYIIKADSVSSKYLGLKVLKVNNIAVNQVEKKIFPYLSGLENWKKYKTLNLVITPKILQAIGIGKKDYLTLSLLKGTDTLKVDFRTKKKKRQVLVSKLGKLISY